ncbi:MAG: hypothetical protein KBD78_04825 [Oligoflexales bacterium]|nr:hypothetical protein [Oligoflexales bacterium]
MDAENKKSDSKIVSIIEFRQKKAIDKETADTRKPLYVSHTQGRVTSSPHLGSTHMDGQDFGDRMSRIRNSLERINNLMAELKAMSKDK